MVVFVVELKCCIVKCINLILIMLGSMLVNFGGMVVCGVEEVEIGVVCGLLVLLVVGLLMGVVIVCRFSVMLVNGGSLLQMSDRVVGVFLV